MYCSAVALTTKMSVAVAKLWLDLTQTSPPEEKWENFFPNFKPCLRWCYTGQFAMPTRNNILNAVRCNTPLWKPFTMFAALLTIGCELFHYKKIVTQLHRILQPAVQDNIPTLIFNAIKINFAADTCWQLSNILINQFLQFWVQAAKLNPHCKLWWIWGCGGRGEGARGGGGFKGFSWTPLFCWFTLALSKMYPKRPENGFSDVPDFKIFHRGACPRITLDCRTFGSSKFKPLLTKSWICPGQGHEENHSRWCVLHEWLSATLILSNHCCKSISPIILPFHWEVAPWRIVVPKIWHIGANAKTILNCTVCKYL